MTEVVGIRFPFDNKIHYYNPSEIELKKGDWCVVETEQGIDLGEIKEESKIIEHQKGKKPLYKILRKANEKDLLIAEENKKREREVYKICHQKIEERDMQMKLVKVYFSFDKSKVTFYFTSENRVDFRELVKDLAHHCKARIEMRQIGVRDEARIFSEYSWCGRPLCCTSFLKDFTSVTIKMAKEQNLILTPSKISGICGRLMCCLAYEHDYYSQFRKKAPKIGSKILTTMGEGIVKSHDPMKETVEVKFDNDNENKIVIFHLSDILEQKKEHFNKRCPEHEKGNRCACNGKQNYD